MDKKTQSELLALVKRNYDEIAEEFDQTRRKFIGSRWDELWRFAAKVEPGARVLDAGCGNGRLYEMFKDKDVLYVGIDSNIKLVGYARKNFQSSAGSARARAGERTPKFLVGDILELGSIPELENAFFDRIFCVAVLHHLPGRDLRVKVLKGFKNKLNADGRIFLTVWNLWGEAKYRFQAVKFGLLKLIGRNRMDFGDIVFRGFGKESPRYYHMFTAGELDKIIKSAGLAVDRLHKDAYNYYAVIR